MKQNAFTLAELLITLGIIGVIAALTLPSIIADYKWKVLEAQFKTSYSIFSRAAKQFYNDNPEIYDGHYRSYYPGYGNWGYSTGDFEQALIATFKGVEVIKTTKDIPYFGFNGEYYGKIYIDKGRSYYQLPNGMSFLISSVGRWQDSSYSSTYVVPTIEVDINGYQKGPNRFGFDMFTFYFDEEGILKGNYTNEDLYIDGCSNGHLTSHNCAEYALADIAPAINTSNISRDETSGYFKNLPKYKASNPFQ